MADTPADISMPLKLLRINGKNVSIEMYRQLPRRQLTVSYDAGTGTLKVEGKVLGWINYSEGEPCLDLTGPGPCYPPGRSAITRHLHILHVQEGSVLKDVLFDRCLPRSISKPTDKTWQAWDTLFQKVVDMGQHYIGC
jgi:hypothetical protein